MDWEFGISRCNLQYIGQINKVLLHSTGNCTQCSVTNHNGKQCVCVCVCVCVTESLCYTEEFNTVNQLYFNKMQFFQKEAYSLT